MTEKTAWLSHALLMYDEIKSVHSLKRTFPSGLMIVPILRPVTVLLVDHAWVRKAGMWTIDFDAYMYKDVMKLISGFKAFHMRLIRILAMNHWGHGMGAVLHLRDSVEMLLLYYVDPCASRPDL